MRLFESKDDVMGHESDMAPMSTHASPFCSLDAACDGFVSHFSCILYLCVSCAFLISVLSLGACMGPVLDGVSPPFSRYMYMVLHGREWLSAWDH